MDEPFPSQLAKFKERKRKENGGFVTTTDMPFILKEDPMCKLLVKHGMGRFICTAQDLAFMIECIEDHPKGYIRSVEFYNPPPPGARVVCDNTVKLSNGKTISNR